MASDRVRRKVYGQLQRELRSRRRAGMVAAASHPLAGSRFAPHPPAMNSLTKTELVGFMQLQVGSLAVRVPIRAAEPVAAMPLASFEVEDDGYAILIRGDSSSKAVEKAMGEAAKQAVQHLSRKLLN